MSVNTLSPRWQRLNRQRPAASVRAAPQPSRAVRTVSSGKISRDHRFNSRTSQTFPAWRTPPLNGSSGTAGSSASCRTCSTNPRCGNIVVSRLLLVTDFLSVDSGHCRPYSAQYLQIAGALSHMQTAAQNALLRAEQLEREKDALRKSEVSLRAEMDVMRRCLGQADVVNFFLGNDSASFRSPLKQRSLPYLHPDHFRIARQ